MNYIQLGVIALVAFGMGYMICKMTVVKSIVQHRRQAVKQSQNVISGHVYEKTAPFAPGFPYQARDMVFIGKGIDYIVFDGLSTGKLTNIIMLEIKSGKSQQNTHEKQIQQFLQNHKVQYELYRIDGKEGRGSI